MRKFFILSTLFLAVLIGLGAAGGAALASAAPFHAGQTLYPVQRFAEQRRAALAADATSRAQNQIALLERRVMDLALGVGSPYESAALEEVYRQLQTTLDALARAPERDAAILKSALERSLTTLQQELPLLTRAPVESGPAYQALYNETGTLLNMLSDSGVSLSTLGAMSEAAQVDALTGLADINAPGGGMQNGTPVDPQMVMFPPGSAGAQHAFYPLVGAHSTLECAACHSSGQYAGTPAACAACHQQDAPVPHFPADCAACHAPTSWQDIHFDHKAAGATDCASCHNQDKPANHFQGQCSACHSTKAWKPATFNHQAAGATDCVSCHTKNKPANHFSGQCSLCHSTNAWKPANFNHQAAGATDCVACHTKNKPANHFSGQCSLCHSTNAWKPATFNHQAAGATDCVACHTKDRPANHFSGQCSQCHSTNAWKPANFNHSFPLNHGDANGQCSKCHPNDPPKWTCYTCHDQNKLVQKHNDEGIGNIDGRCLECHANGDKGGEGGGD